MKSTAKVSGFDFNGDLVKRTIKVEPYDDSLIKIDDWCPADIGELCLYNRKIGHVRSIRWSEPDGMFKGCYMYLTSIEDTWVSDGMVNRVEVLEGKVYTLYGKDYTHLPATNGDFLKKYIDITKQEHITNLPLMNEAFRAGIAAFSTKRKYYEDMFAGNKGESPVIPNPYESMDIMNYHRHEVIDSWEAGFKKADDDFVVEVRVRSRKKYA